MSRLLCALAAVTLLAGYGASLPVLAQAQAQDQDHDQPKMRAAVPQLPFSRGDPTRVISAPGSTIWSAMFDPLVLVGDQGQVEPVLARDWQMVDSLTWRFNLRPGITFHDGSQLTADDVVASVAFLLTPEGKATGVGATVTGITAVRAIDPLTVEIVTGTPNIMLFRELAAMMVVEDTAWARLGPNGYAGQPVGTGPYRVTDWTASEVRMLAHRGGVRQPGLAALDLVQISDTSARLQALLSRQADVAIGLGPDQIAPVEQSGGRMLVTPWASTQAILLDNLRGGPLADARVRMALNMAVDRQAIVDALLAGSAPLASQPAPAGAFGYNPDLQPIPFDRDGARALLAEAGYPDGFEMTIDATVGFLPNDESIFQQVAQDLARVGVRARINVISNSSMIQAVMVGGLKGDAYVLGYAAMPSGDALRSMRLRGCHWPHPVWCDPEIQAVIDEAEAQTDLARREALTRTAMAMLRDRAQSLYLTQVVDFVGLGPRVAAFDVWGTWPRWETLTGR